MRIGNVLKILALGIVINIVTYATSFAALPLNDKSTPVIPDSPPIISGVLLDDPFPIAPSTLRGLGYTYWSYKSRSGSIWPHTAIDLDALLDTTVYSVNMGTVRYLRKKPAGFGNFVIIDSWMPTLYAHLNKNYLTEGDPVIQGIQIGTVGNSTSFLQNFGPHLHFMYGENEGSTNNLNPLKVWIRQFNVTSISAAGPILQPDGIKQKVAYTFLQPNSVGSYPTTVNISGNLSSQFYAAYPYGVRAVLYINNQRMKDANNVPLDQLAALDGTFAFTNVTLQQPVPADRTYHIAAVLFDTEEVQNDTSSLKYTYVDKSVPSAVKDPIARADVDLYVPEDLKPTATPASPYEGDSVKFDLTAPTLGSGQYTYQWDFGDGGADSGLTPSHSYSAAGIYSVKVLATDDILHQVVGMGKVQVTVQKKPDPNPPTPGGPGGGLPGGPQDPNGAICGSSCGVLGGTLNALSAKMSSVALLNFLKSGTKVNPAPQCKLVPFQEVCGGYGRVDVYDFTNWQVGQPPVQADTRYVKNPWTPPAGWLDIFHWVNLPASGYVGKIFYNYMPYAGFPVQCSSIPPDGLVPDDLFTTPSQYPTLLDKVKGSLPPDGDYVTSDGHLVQVKGGTGTDMGPDTKGPNGAARKPGFYPANGQSCG